MWVRVGVLASAAVRVPVVTAFLDMPFARQAAESLMTSTCRLFTPGAPVTDPETGMVTYTETGVTRSPCRVRPNGYAQSHDSEVGGAEVVATGYVVSLPFTATPVVLQRLVVESSPDGSLVGLVLEVRQVARGDNITARRLLCTEVA